MAHTTWINSTPLNPTNINEFVQRDDVRPTSSTFNGSSGRVITHGKGHQNYMFLYIPTANPGGNLGEVYITKANDTVTVYNSGSFRGNFDYVIIPYG